MGRLARYQPGAQCWFVPLVDIQRHVVSVAPPAFRTLLYRRFMLRMAERIARRARAKAIVTGDAVGQVASQTLDNLAALDTIATMPVLRPLVGFTKEEIVAEARRIGTYPFSIADGDDCCQLFAPRRVATDATPRSSMPSRRGWTWSALVGAAMRAAERERAEGGLGRSWPRLSESGGRGRRAVRAAWDPRPGPGQPQARQPSSRARPVRSRRIDAARPGTREAPPPVLRNASSSHGTVGRGEGARLERLLVVREVAACHVAA